MASILKAQTANAAKADAKGKRKADDMAVDDDEEVESPAPKKKNKQRVLLLSSRGVTHRMRHLMNDLEALLPHVKKGARLVIYIFDTTCLVNLGRFEAGFEIPAAPPTRTGRSE